MWTQYYGILETVIFPFYQVHHICIMNQANMWCNPIGWSPCSGDTMTPNILIEIPFGGVNVHQDDPNYVIKRISENTYNISSLNQNEITKIEVFDLMGRTIKANLNALNMHSVNIELNKKGQMLFSI